MICDDSPPVGAWTTAAMPGLHAGGMPDFHACTCQRIMPGRVHVCAFAVRYLAHRGDWLGGGRTVVVGTA